MSSHFQFLGLTSYIGIDSKNNHTGAGAGAGAGNCYLLVVFVLHSLWYLRAIFSLLRKFYGRPFLILILIFE
jgi:hypothetical protein